MWNMTVLQWSNPTTKERRNTSINHHSSRFQLLRVYCGFPGVLCSLFGGMDDQLRSTRPKVVCPQAQMPSPRSSPGPGLGSHGGLEPPHLELRGVRGGAEEPGLRPGERMAPCADLYTYSYAYIYIYIYRYEHIHI